MGIIGIILFSLTIIIILVINLKQKKTLTCPKCAYQVKRFRIPKSFKQFMWGGWICPNCNCKFTLKGNPIETMEVEDFQYTSLFVKDK